MHQDEITLKRGDREVTLRKLPDYFAVRLTQGRATDEAALEAACGSPRSEVRHVEAVPSEQMDVFAVRDPDRLEDTTDELRKAPTSSVVTHVYSLDDTPGDAVIPTGTMTVQFGADLNDRGREEILAEFGLEVVEELDFLIDGYTVRLTGASPGNPLKTAKELQSRAEIETAEPDLSFRISLAHTPADPLYPQQWYLDNRGEGTGLKAGADVKAEDAWEYTRGSRDVVVCVMDDGFDLGHPDFDAPDKIVAPRDFGGSDFDPSPAGEDDDHGTACAGVAVAEENGTGIVGLAPRSSFMPVRTSGWLSDESLRRLFQYAIDHDADVISCSWSARAWDFPLSTKIHGIIHKAATQGRANGKGCVILFAAGNENRPLDDEKDGRVSHQGFALHPDVISVGASNSLDERSWYSNYGEALSLCAPSSGYPGRGITTTDRRGHKGYSPEDYTTSFGGTSSATPLAAGLAALILSLKPEFSSAEVREIMMETADEIDEEDGEYDGRGHSELYGHGRINALRALARVAGEDEERLPRVLSMEHRVDRPIPDTGLVEDTIPFPLDVVPRSLEVGLDVRHTWRGDLRVTLTPPDGDPIVLVNRTGGSRDDLVREFRSSDDPGLFEDALAAPADGDWTLTIEDLAARDVGTLSKWGLAVAYE